MSDYEKREIMYYANTKDPDQTAHLHTLIRIFTVNQYTRDVRNELLIVL